MTLTKVRQGQEYGASSFSLLSSFGAISLNNASDSTISPFTGLSGSSRAHTRTGAGRQTGTGTNEREGSRCGRRGLSPGYQCERCFTVHRVHCASAGNPSCWRSTVRSSRLRRAHRSDRPRSLPWRPLLSRSPARTSRRAPSPLPSSGARR